MSPPPTAAATDPTLGAPLTWEAIRHQENAVGLLTRALHSGRTHHAFLFEGPEGVGKELTARVLAARLLCLQPAGAPAEGRGEPGLLDFAAGEPDESEECAQSSDNPCGRCASCRMLASGNHPDFTVLDRALRRFHPDRAVRASKGLFLGVDLIRHFLIEPSGRKPSQGARRVFLIREAERLNEEAQNALLKTLEEPPGESVLILVTASAARLLPTIRSRCQRVAFRWLPTSFVEAELRRRLKLEPAAAARLAELSTGRLGAALNWHALGLLRAYERVAELLAGSEASDPETFGKTLADLAVGLAERSQRAADPEEAADDPPGEDDEDEPSDGPRNARKIPTDVFRDMLKLVLMLTAAVLRERLVVQCGAADAARSDARAVGGGARHSGGDALDRLEAGIRAVADTERLLDRNVAPPLALERLSVLLHSDAAMLRV